MSDEKLKEEQIELVAKPDEVETRSMENEKRSAERAVDLDDESALQAGRVSFAQKVVGDRFEVLDVVGQGGMGSVYKVRDRDTDRIVALKLLKPELCQDKSVLKRFMHEAASLAELDHDNIITVYDHGITGDGAPYLVMQYLDGGTLADLLLKEGKVSPTQAIDLTGQICQALDYAHKRKFVHRDIKPSNVILVNDELAGGPQVQLVDFGIAKIVESPAANNTNLTQTGDVFGTPAYMSPEQCQGGDIDQRTDIYSVGCILYEMLTGKQPFAGANAIQIAIKHINGSPDPFAEKLPDGHILRSLEEIVFKCMRKEPTERYQSVAELHADLKLVKAGRTVGYAESIEVEKSDRKKSVSKPVAFVQFIAHGLGGWFMVIMYLVTILGFTNMDPTSTQDTSRSGLIVMGMIGFFIHFRGAWRVITRIGKRRAMLDWIESFLIISVFSTYILAITLGIVNIPSQFADWLVLAFFASATSTGVLLTTGMVIFIAAQIRHRTISLIDWFKKRQDPSHVPARMQRIPISLSRGLARTLICSAAIVGLGVLAAPSMLSYIISNGYGPLLSRTRLPAAGSLIETAIKLNSKNTEAYNILAQFCTTNGDQAKALQALNAGIAFAPLDPQLLLARGKLERKLGQMQAALDDLNKVESTEADIEVARTYIAMGDFKAAEKRFTEAIEDGDHNFSSMEDCYSGRGLAHYAERNYAAALEDFSKAIENAYLSRDLAYARRGLANRALGNSAAARLDFEAAIRNCTYYKGNNALVRAFAYKQIGNNAESEQSLKDSGLGKEMLKNVLLPDIPLITLDW